VIHEVQHALLYISLYTTDLHEELEPASELLQVLSDESTSDGSIRVERSVDTNIVYMVDRPSSSIDLVRSTAIGYDSGETVSSHSNGSDETMRHADSPRLAQQQVFLRKKVMLLFKRAG
jgi:hypothetical protein